MKTTKRSEAAKARSDASKAAWRNSPAGKAYHANYHAVRMTDPAQKAKKAEAQRVRRKNSPRRKKLEAEYNFHYTRRPEVKAVKNAKRRARRQDDVGYRLTERIRGRIKNLLGKDKPESTSRSLGCTAGELVAYLELQFLPGMSWDNYGFDGWHIDHIKTLASFYLKQLQQYRQACHYTNLQPLWAKDNLRKGNKCV